MQVLLNSRNIIFVVQICYLLFKIKNCLDAKS